jgi:toxin FitB
MFLLDTNVVSELRPRKQRNAAVAAWVAGQPASRLFLSVVTLLELEMGVLAIERKDAAQGKLLRQWLVMHLRPAFANRILPIDEAVAIRCAGLHVPDRRPERDAYIAATALVHGMAVATRNIRDFEPMGVTVVDPWAWAG